MSADELSRLEVMQRLEGKCLKQKDAHHPLTHFENLAQILTWQELRTVSKNLAIQFKKVVYQIQTDRPSYALRNAQVTVDENAVGQFLILYKTKLLKFTIFHKQELLAEIVDTKDLDQVKKTTQTPKPSPRPPLAKVRNLEPQNNPHLP